MLQKVNVISYNIKTNKQEVKEVERDIVPHVEPIVPKTEVEKLQDTVNYLMDTLILNSY